LIDCDIKDEKGKPVGTSGWQLNNDDANESGQGIPAAHKSNNRGELILAAKAFKGI